MIRRFSRAGISITPLSFSEGATCSGGADCIGGIDSAGGVRIKGNNGNGEAIAGPALATMPIPNTQQTAARRKCGLALFTLNMARPCLIAIALIVGARGEQYRGAV